MVLFLVLQTHYLNKGMDLGDTMSVVPVYQGFWIMFTTIGGSIFDNFSKQSYLYMNLGFLLMFLGVLFLMRHGHIAYLISKALGNDAHSTIKHITDMPVRDLFHKTLDIPELRSAHVWETSLATTRAGSTAGSDLEKPLAGVYDGDDRAYLEMEGGGGGVKQQQQQGKLQLAKNKAAPVDLMESNALYREL
jgi:hypothetical protein